MIIMIWYFVEVPRYAVRQFGCIVALNSIIGQGTLPKVPKFPTGTVPADGLVLLGVWTFPDNVLTQPGLRKRARPTR